METLDRLKYHIDSAKYRYHLYGDNYDLRLYSETIDMIYNSQSHMLRLYGVILINEYYSINVAEQTILKLYIENKFNIFITHIY